MAATSNEAFFDVLAKSEILSAPKLAEVRAKFGSEPDLKVIGRELVKLGMITKWQAGMLLAGRSALKLGKYTLLEQIGTEEVGLVYLAEHVQMGRRVVIKTLSSKHTSNPQAVKRFLDEAQRIAALHHRNIIHLFDVSSEGERYYIVLEHSEGRDFQNLIVAEGPISRDLAADYLIQAAEGLAHAHGKKLYHGDIKPENLLVDAQGQVKILNFGVARLVEGGGQPADAATDLAALGEVGTYLLTGKSGLANRASAPPGIETICLKLASKSISERFASAEEAIAAIKKWQGEQSASGPADAPKIERTVAPSVKKPKESPPPRSKPKPPALSRPASRTAEPPPEPEPVDEGLGAIKIVTTGTGTKSSQFNISVGGTATKAKTKSKAKLAAKEKVQAKPSEGEEGAAPTPARKIPLAMIIGGSVGGGVLAMLLLALGLFMFWPRGENVVAKVDPDKAAEPIEVDPEDEVKKPEPEPVKQPDPKPEPAKPVEPPKPEPMPVVPPVEPAKPDPPPVVAEKPVDPPKPEPMPAPPAGPAQNPFKDLPTLADLPDLGTAEKPAEGATAPFTLGPLTAQPKDILLIDLAGGDKTSKGKLAFFIKPAKGGAADRDWEITMSATGEDTGGEVVAKLSVQEGNLNFEWTDKAVADPLANQLRNCVLSSRTGAFTHSLALRKPVEATPITVAWKKPMKAEAVFDFAPSPEAMEIEITSLEGPFPKHRIAPKQSFEAVKGECDIHIGKDDKEETLILHLASSLRKGVQIVATPLFKIKVNNQPYKFTEKIANDTMKQVSLRQSFLFNSVDFMNKEKDPTKVSILAPQKALAEQELAKFQQAISQFDEIKSTSELLNNTGKIHYRIYYLAGDQQVELARTSPATPAAPGAAPPNVAPPAN